MDNLRRVDNSKVLKDEWFPRTGLDTILGGVADAFDLSGEDPESVKRYATIGALLFNQRV